MFRAKTVAWSGRPFRNRSATFKVPASTARSSGLVPPVTVIRWRPGARTWARSGDHGLACNNIKGPRQVQIRLPSEPDKAGSDNNASSFNGKPTMRSDEKQNAVEHESVVAQKNQIIDRQDKRIKELQEQLNQRGLAGDIDPSLLPDGRVASILGDKKLVYIDRGRADHIIRGLTF